VSKEQKGRDFSCFTRTKVQILTLRHGTGALHARPLRREAPQSHTGLLLALLLPLFTASFTPSLTTSLTTSFTTSLKREAPQSHTGLCQEGLVVKLVVELVVVKRVYKQDSINETICKAPEASSKAST
jgi:hypothetical protein